MKPKQHKLFKDSPKAYGGELRKKAKARGARPIVTKSTMHLVLRSSKAKAAWSFRRHQQPLAEIIARFSYKYGVQVLSLANVGNHLHMQVKLSNRYTYEKFIKAITGAITMLVTKASKVNPLKERFWDYRPFTRVVIGFKAHLTLKNYIQMNKLEGKGYAREEAFSLTEFYKKWMARRFGREFAAI